MKEYNGEVYSEVTNQKGLVLVDFFATWCGPCKLLTPVLEDLSKDDAYNIIKVDIDKFRPVAIEEQIKSVPTLILYKDGIELARHSGFLPKEELIAWINSK